MKNLALWYERTFSETSSKDIDNGQIAKGPNNELKDSSLTPVNAEIHFNFWRIPKEPLRRRIFRKSYWHKLWADKKLSFDKDHTFHRVLDIGIKVEDIARIENICLFIPDPSISNRDIQDLGEKITSDTRLLNAVFNENVDLNKEFAKNYATVTLVKNEPIKELESLVVARFNDEEYYKLESKYGGKILRINTKGHSGKFYLRFRITKESLFAPIIDKPNDSIFHSALTLEEIIDFRFNEARGLPEKLFADIDNISIQNEKSFKSSYFAINKIHFLYICNSKEDFIIGHQDFSSCRLLENDIWRTYADGLNLGNSKYVAYHWKEKVELGKNIGSFNAFIKTRFHHSNWLILFKYLFYILVIGAITNGFYDLIKYILKYIEIYTGNFFITNFLNKIKEVIHFLF